MVLILDTSAKCKVSDEGAFKKDKLISYLSWIRRVSTEYCSEIGNVVFIRT